MATLTVYPDPDVETTTVDGYVYRQTSENWATIIAGAGTHVNDSFATGNFAAISSDAGSNLWFRLFRSVFLFDTSALLAGATVSAAVMSVYVNARSDALAISPTTDVYASTPASNTSLAAADYGQIGSTSQTGAATAYANITNNAYNDFTFNATGIGNVNKTGISKFGIRNANYDVAASAPTWSSELTSAVGGMFADSAGTANDPKLVITYTLPANTGFFLLM